MDGKEGGQEGNIGMNGLIDDIHAQAEKAEQKALEAKAHHDRFKIKAGDAAEKGDHAKAHTLRNVMAGYLNDYFYWHGQAVALSAVAAGLGLRGMVEEELDATPTCP